MCSLSVLNLLLYLLFTVKRVCPFQDTIRHLNTEFARNLYQKLTVDEEYRNIIISPTGVSIALELLQLGAKGNTFMQLENALGYTVHDSRVRHFLQSMYGDLANSTLTPTIHLACGLFVEANMQLSSHFSEDTAAWLNGSLQRVNLSNPNETAVLINKWVTTKSQGEIKDFMPQPMARASLTQIAVISTVYFKSTWENQFSTSKTQHLSFTRADGSVVKVPMMYQTSTVNYGQVKTKSNQRFKAIELNYLEHAVSMLIVIPSEREKLISSVESHITALTLSAWTNSMRRMKMEVFLPKFKVQSKFNLKTLLTTLGITDLFNPSKADFSGISEQEKLFVSEAIHEAKIEVTEDGTEAAAATAVVLLKRSRALAFKADRPFFFLLRHTTGRILFMGRVMDPLE
ncbi:probable serpin E3 isoform X1 [Stegostoma tigrinum]|uniref:probable serpin E3 isoform X1 n=1 Tax=Stegostoma tigrinum TaxID=3053191 RepID=UPI00286FB2EC|nr:probable serpin E3 isoform X1 [Stegostoma tigrinum]